MNMHPGYLCRLIVVALLLDSCKPVQKFEKVVARRFFESSEQISLANNYTLVADRKYELLSIVEPGSPWNRYRLLSEDDSISFEISTGIDTVLRRPCSLADDAKNLQELINGRPFKDMNMIGSHNYAYIDTVDNRIVQVIRPVHYISGKVYMTVSDCKTGAWINIFGASPTVKNEEAFLRLYKSVQFKR